MQRLPYIVLAAIALIAGGWVIMATQPNGSHADAQNPPSSAEDLDKNAGIGQDAPKPAPSTDQLLAQYQARAGGRDEFAADRNPKPLEVSPAPFDGERAMGYLKDICGIGPRISGSEGMKRQQEVLKKHFEDNGAKVELQKFKATQKSKRNEDVEMANMVISFWPDRQRRMILCSHYDTRPIADQEPDERKWREPFISANDGGSGVAFLMEMARHIKDLNINNIGVDFVLFDGEEYIWDSKTDEYFFGSKHFAQQAQKGKVKYMGAILLDMIAGKDARFPKDAQSVVLAGALVESVWKVAAEQKCNVFVHQNSNVMVEDDHVPLNRAKIPAIDLIDFSYKHWHRLSDTPANCAAEPMEQVSKVLSIWLQRVK